MSDVIDPSSGLDPEGNPLSPEGNSGSNEPEGKGRTLENIRGELVRKHDKLAEQVDALQDAISQLSQALLAKRNPEPQPRPQQPVVSPYGAPSPGLDEYTDEQLAQALASGSLTPYQRQVIEATIQDRRVERKTTQIISQKQRESDVARLRAESEAAALQAFPALRDSKSEFSKRVEAELKKQREQLGDFPTDKFDVANRIARVMGVEVSRVTRGFSGSTEPANVPTPDPDPLGLDEAELQRIAQKLQYAMPLKRGKDGKLVRKQFDLKRIKERAKTYDENSQFYRGTKMGGK